MSMKNYSDNIGNRTRDLLACSAVPQPTALPRARIYIYIYIYVYIYICIYVYTHIVDNSLYTGCPKKIVPFSKMFCCFVGAILKLLCPRERRVFQSKVGISSSNQCNLHHSPHTGHLEKKIKKGTK
jgi:hypothetical protein